MPTPTLELSVIHRALSDLLIMVDTPIRRLAVNDHSVLGGQHKVDDAAMRLAEEDIRKFLYGEQGIIATFSKDGTIKEIAQRHVDLIDRAKKQSETWAMGEILPQYALRCSQIIQQEVPGLTAGIKSILAQKRGK